VSAGSGQGPKRLIEARAREANRVLKVLETANIKLGSVVPTVLGGSARARRKALSAGAGTPEELAELAKRSLRRKRPALAEALTGRVTAHHRFLLAQLLRHIEFLDAALATCDGRIATCTAAEAAAIARLDTMPGVARRTAETLVAELGCDMTRFPTAGHAASGAGLCPGNHESAGKRLSGRTRFATRVLRQARVESARGAVLKRGSSLAAHYHRLVKRRGDKKALVAVAQSLTRYHTKRLTALGYTVTLAKDAA
jgi:transposase